MQTDADGNEIGKLFVGGLSQATNDNSLRNYFSQLGDVEDSIVMMDNKTGRSRGFGYVKYRNPESVSMILQSKPHTIDGKEVDVKQCNINMKGKNRRSLKIFVGGISLEHDNESIKQFFEQFGKVTDVNLMMDQSKNRHRGFAFVGFEDESVVKKLINMHFVTIKSKQVEVKAMEPPNFGKKSTPTFLDSNVSNNCVNNGLDNNACYPLQALTPTIVSTNSNGQMPGQLYWRPPNNSIHYPILWSTTPTPQPLTNTSLWPNNSTNNTNTNLQSTTPTNNHPPQWAVHCDQSYWPTTAVNWTNQTNIPNWYNQFITSQSMWPQSNIPLAPIVNKQTQPPTTLFNNTDSNQPQIISYVPTTQLNTNEINTNETTIDEIQSNKLTFTNYYNNDTNKHLEQITPRDDYNNQWAFSNDKEYLNSNVLLMTTNEMNVPGNGEGDSFNRNHLAVNSYPYYATRN